MAGGTLNIGGGSNAGSLDLSGGTLRASLVVTNTSNDTLSVGGGNVILKGNQFTNQVDALFDLGTGTLQVAGDLINTENSGGDTGIFRTATGGTVIFNGDSLAVGFQNIEGNFASPNNFENLTINEGSKVNPEPEGSNPITISGNLDISGVYGQSGETSNVLYSGFNFSIGGTGTFRANELDFNNPPSELGDPVSASGEVFSLVRLTGGTYVQLSTQFIINGLLVIDSSDELFLASGGSLVLNDDFENNGTYTPNQRATIFSGQTNTGGGDPSLTTCSGVKTNDGDCEQDTRGSGALDFGPVQINLDNTRVTLSTDNENPDIPNVTDLTIDPDDDNTNVALILNNTNLNISGDLENNGTFSAGTRLVTFNGGGNQDIISSVPITFSRLAVKNGGGSAVDVRINSNADIVVTDTLRLEEGGLGFAPSATNATLEVQNELNVKSGTLDATGGPVTLVSDGATEAYIRYNDEDANGTLDGGITGDIIKQRELGSSQNWYYLSGPASTGTNDTFDEFLREGTNTNSLWLQGFSGANAETSNPSVSNVRIYDETVSGDDNNGWVSINGASNQMVSGRGYIVYAFSDDNFDGTVEPTPIEAFPKLLDSDVETYFGKSFTYPSSLFTVTDNGPGAQDGNSSVDEDEGWNLLGNPYLATLDWTQLTRTNLDDAVYVYDPQNGVYVAFGADAMVGGLTDGNIAPQQAFFVKANATSPSLEIDDITTDQAGTSNFFQKSRTDLPPAVAFRASITGIERETYVAFLEGSSMGKDPDDAYQLGSPLTDSQGNFSLFTTLEDGTGININALPYGITEETAIPMAAIARGCRDGIPFSGTVTLTWPEIRSMPDTVGLAIRDTQTGDLIDMRAQSSYEFTVSSDDNCSTQNLQQATGGQPMTAVPEPSVVKLPMSKNSSGGTRLEFIVTPNSALPVEFGRFAGSADGENAALLEWSTLSETNNAGFYVEQKVDGRFQTVSPLVASKAESGTSSESLSYRYRVADLDLGTTHTFRLRQVDVDGSPTLSEPVDVTLGIAGEYRLEAYPNPVQSGQQATVGFAVKERQPVSIELYNTLGQRVRTIYDDTPQVVDELETVTLDIGDLASGLYFVRMRGESFTTTQKLVVVR